MPLIDAMLREAGIEREQIRALAVAAGPGSFTGLRIGIATARGLAQGLDIPAVPVCTLAAMAESAFTPGALICPILDARRKQVYTALFRRPQSGSGELETLIEPAALSLSELAEMLKEYEYPITFIGEGLHSYAEEITGLLPLQANLTAAPFRLCRAALVALRGQKELEKKPLSSYRDLVPRYLRRPEAERKSASQERAD